MVQEPFMYIEIGGVHTDNHPKSSSDGYFPRTDQIL